jgi:hypothetical protein
MAEAGDRKHERNGNEEDGPHQFNKRVSNLFQSGCNGSAL